jgi:hypothetical protein
MVLVDVHCKTCCNDFQLDIGDKTVGQIKEILSKRTEFHCNAGNHFENESPMNHWVLGEVHDGSAPDEKEWFKRATEQHGRLYDTDELTKNFEVTGFACGACMAKNRITGEHVCLEFIHSPKGNRFYYE